MAIFGGASASAFSSVASASAAYASNPLASLGAGIGSVSPFQALAGSFGAGIPSGFGGGGTTINIGNLNIGTLNGGLGIGGLGIGGIGGGGFDPTAALGGLGGAYASASAGGAYQLGGGGIMQLLESLISSLSMLQQSWAGFGGSSAFASAYSPPQSSYAAAYSPPGAAPQAATAVAYTPPPAAAPPPPAGGGGGGYG